MSEITVKRRSSNGRETTYCVGVRDETDRTIHDVTVVHNNEVYDFANHQDMLVYVFEHLLANGSKEEIRSAFRIEDLLAHDPALQDAVNRYRFVPAARRADWLIA